jgi:choline monooxygenase
VQVTQEDVTVCEAVQERLASGGYAVPGYLSPRHEAGVAYFQDRVRQVHNLHSSPEDQY